MERSVTVVAAVALLVFLGFVLWRLYRSVRRGLSIRMQVFVAMAAVSGGFAALLGVIAVQRLELRAARLFAEVAQGDAELFARLIDANRPLPEAARALSLLRIDSARSGKLRIEVTDPSGQTVYVAGPEIAAVRGVSGLAEVRGADGTARGSVLVVRAGLGLRAILREVAARAAVLALLLVMGTAGAAALVGQAIAKPIERLTSAASRIARGERTVALPKPFGREVRTLTDALSSMRRELEGRPLAERLAADLSHELKNPVAAIRASAEVLADGALEEPEVARRFVGRILEATERVLSIVNNLLVLTRLQARGVIEEDVDVAALLHVAADALSPRAAKRRIAVRIEAPPSGFLVRGDATWLRRALDNLLDNALSFAEPDEAAGPQTGEPAVRIRARADEQQVRIEVENRGPGVAKEVRSRLFQRFVTTRRDDGGSGLGLAIVAAVAEQHGGSVELAEPGPPLTRFELVLPRT